MRWHYSQGHAVLETGPVRRVGREEVLGSDHFRHRGESPPRPPVLSCRHRGLRAGPRRPRPGPAAPHLPGASPSSLKLLKRQSPGLRLVVSYADLGPGPPRDALPGRRLALPWDQSDQSYLRIHGRIVHPRTVYDRYGRGGQSVPWLRENVDPKAERVEMAPKLRYVMPLDKALRRKLAPQALPYPKSAAEVTPRRHARCPAGRGGFESHPAAPFLYHHRRAHLSRCPRRAPSARPQRAEIEKALVTGEPSREIAGRFRFPLRVLRSALHRHKHEAPTRAHLAKAHEEESIGQAIDVVRQLKAINSACLEVLQKSRADGKHAISLRAVDRIHRQIELQAKLLGELQEAGPTSTS